VKRIAILGGGGWGTALAIVLSKSHRQHDVALWVRRESLAKELATARVNEAYLSGHRLPDSTQVTHNAAAALENAEIVIAATPAAHTRAIFRELLPYLPQGAAMVSATKGLEPDSHTRMSQVISQTLGPRVHPPIAVLSGPSFAAEVAAGHPTAVVIASESSDLAKQLQEEFAGPTFRLYTNNDVLGVELAGAMKNVMAIAAGACQGIGLGANSVAALITRGLAEMTRLAVGLGAQAETLSGLAGLGDLVLTCTGALSRNRHVGVELGKGRSLKDILAHMTMVAEGVGTAPALLALARETGVDLPITEQVTAILRDGKPPRDAIRSIMERPLKGE
jgi:glycerol-3-phosphate dehydrogenase (NAD(P)+)